MWPIYHCTYCDKDVELWHAAECPSRPQAPVADCECCDEDLCTNPATNCHCDR